MNYTNHQIARTEYEIRNQSLPPVRDEDFLAQSAPDAKPHLPRLRVYAVLAAIVSRVAR